MKTPEELLREHAHTRSEASFRPLYRACTPRLHGFALRLTFGDADLAADVTQETWLRALDRLDRFRDGGSVSAWLAGFALNCWRELRRRERRDDALCDPLLQPAPPHRHDDSWADRHELLAAIHCLAAGYREVLLLHDVEGYTHEEIGEMLGIATGTSKSQLSRARSLLRQMLEPARTAQEE